MFILWHHLRSDQRSPKSLYYSLAATFTRKNCSTSNICVLLQVQTYAQGLPQSWYQCVDFVTSPFEAAASEGVANLHAQIGRPS